MKARSYSCKNNVKEFYEILRYDINDLCYEIEQKKGKKAKELMHTLIKRFMIMLISFNETIEKDFLKRYLSEFYDLTQGIDLEKYPAIFELIELIKFENKI
ncbi:hypothetical protein [Caldicellulosiruptor acetigenus]|uniref:Uncharacterized protein n=1 Tax=Caldicellulosiruptor acetigenus 6A TaxID=632516 RepID=G2PX01_9FIRM|nr:hypothetical protein [Caldicellulosiruptor acetigenus]AEM72956.1 hypothetical protein Calla_0279 [Caldicellulosiruptor acetigenus 6A]